MKEHFCLISVVAILLALPAIAATPEDLEQQNESLRQQNEQMQMELREMHARMDAFEQALSDKLDKAEYQQQARAQLQELLAEQPTSQQWVSTLAANTKLQIYGFLRTDASYDTRKTEGGYLAFFVQRDPAGIGKRDELNITARNSRLGFALTFPEHNEIEVSGRLEMDFGTPQTVGTAELSPAIRLRHAYIQVKAPYATFIAGQTWDVFSPLFPYTENVSILWMAGNVGTRRPQFRVERDWHLADGHKLLTQLAVARAVGGNSFAATGDGLDDGSASGVPDLQGRVAYSTRFLTEKDTTIGVSGVWGRRDAVSAAVGDVSYSAAGLAVDLVLPLTEKLSFRGETYGGQGLGGYYGHIGQYFDEGTRRPVRGIGGWGEFSYQLTKDLVIRSGAGLDCVDSDRLSTADQRTFNFIPFLNYSYKITPNLVWGMEYQYLRTRYLGGDSFDAHRLSTSFTLNF